MQEWHTSKNAGIDPATLARSSKKIYWWQCLKGHEFQASTDNRSRGKGCPFCANRRIDETNNLAFVHPGLASEWHPTRNGNVTPDQVGAGSAKRYWWVCGQMHEWEAPVSVRATGKGCRICANDKMRKEVAPKQIRTINNRLIDVRPDVAEQWIAEKNPDTDLSLVQTYSGKKYWWRCQRGHEWLSTVSNRTRQNSGCPLCGNQSSKIEIRLVVELREVFGRSNVEWRSKIQGHECDIYLPSYQVGIEYDGSYWHKNKLTKDEVKNKVLAEHGVRLIRLRDRSLPTIGDSIVIEDTGGNDSQILRMLFRRLVELDLNPQDKIRVDQYLESKDFVANDEYMRIVASLPGPPEEDSLLILSPKIASEWHYSRNAPLRPEMMNLSSGQKVWWICEKGHEWKAVIASRTSRNSGCPTCSGRIAIPETSLQAHSPELAQQWHPTLNGDLKPNQLRPNSNVTVWWQCANGHSWQASVNNRFGRGSGCQICSGKVASEFHNLEVKNPALAQQWHPTKNESLTPRTFAPRSGKRAWWLCEKGHEWEATIANRSGGRGCPVCAGRKVIPL
jgi:very-short-patch-repair endonuclease